MRKKLLDVLACPRCRGELSLDEETTDDGEIVSGSLGCATCSIAFPIRAGIPRFVDSDNYAASFGLQWNRFKREQIDSLSGLSKSRERFFRETGWTSEEIRGRWILDAGCGAGRFLDIASQAGAEVVGVDVSNAVDAARESVGMRPNVHLVQASIYELPFRSGAFDACYCIGVVQHTPDPAATVRALPSVVKAGGQIALTIYERRRFTLLYSKYLVRPVTRRMPPKLLLGLLSAILPVAFVVTEVLFRIPVLGRLFRFTIPIANYVGEPGLSMGDRYRWAKLDTFDMLAPRHDQPQREADVRALLEAERVVRITRMSAPGLVLVGTRA
jgi:uncharacterized protein YbaR (Trm112 family)/ubiquinone/menaquinone biosynthesis C-methylase UbiE